MNHLFCPYQEAIELKQLGFEEDCFGWYFKDKSFYTGLITINSGFLLAPLYSQVFNWFREKHKIHSKINHQNGFYYWEIDDYGVYPVKKYKAKTEVNLFKETELRLLQKLIEIVKKMITQQEATFTTIE